MRDLHFTQYNAVYTTELVRGTASWTDIIAFLMDFKVVPNKDNGRLFSGANWVEENSPNAVFSENKYGKEYFSRCRANALGTDLLILDFDNEGCDRNSMFFAIDQVKEEFKDYEYVCYTSYNHQNPEKDNGVDKFRIVLPLAAYCSKKEWMGREESFKARFAHLKPDVKSFELTQPMYEPIIHPDRKAFAIAWHNTGKWFDWSELEYKNPEEIKKIKYSQAKSNVEASGFKLYPDSILETKKGSIRLGDVIKKVSGVKCPFHGDTNASEFIGFSTHPFLVCKKCGTIHMQIENDSELDDPDTSGLLKFVKSKSKNQLSAVELVNKVKAQALSIDDLLMFDESEPVNVTIERNADRYIEQSKKINIGDAELVFIKAPKGTGKTEKIQSIVADAKSKGQTITLISHRRILSSNLSNRVGLDNYQEQADITDTYAISVDSLHKFDPEVDKPRDLLIIDESEQVLQHLTSDTFKRIRRDVITNLLWLLETSKQIVFLDADLSPEITIDIISWCREITDETKIYGFISEWKAEGSVEMYDSNNHLIELLIKDVNAGRKVFVAVNYRNFGVNLATALDTFVTSKPKILLITSETNSTDEVVKFIADPAAEAPKYDVVIASPTLSTGVSIDGNHFNSVYGFFGNRVYTYQDCDQAISRVRKCDDVKVWIQSSDFEEPEHDEEFLRSKLEREKKTRAILRVGEKAELQQGDKLYAKIYARIVCFVEECKRQKREKFEFLKSLNGFTIAPVQFDADLAKAGKDKFDAAKELNDDRDVLAIYQARDLNADEYQSMKDNKSLGLDDKRAVEKFYYSMFLQGTGVALTTDAIKDIRKNDLVRKFSRMSNAFTATNTLKKRDKAEREGGKGMITDWKHRTLETEVFRDELCGVVGIDYKQLVKDSEQFKAAKDKLNTVMESEPSGSRKYRAATKDFKEFCEQIIFEIPQSKIDALAAHVAKNLVKINTDFGTKFTKPEDKDSKVKVWNGTFGCFGMGLKKVRVMADGEKSVKYVIDFNDILSAKSKQALENEEAAEPAQTVAVPAAPAVKSLKPKITIL